MHTKLRKAVTASFCSGPKPRIPATRQHDFQSLRATAVQGLSSPRKVARIYGCFSSQSFWKAGSERKGSQIGFTLLLSGRSSVARCASRKFKTARNFIHLFLPQNAKHLRQVFQTKLDV